MTATKAGTRAGHTTETAAVPPVTRPDEKAKGLGINRHEPLPAVLLEDLPCFRAARRTTQFSLGLDAIIALSGHGGLGKSVAAEHFSSESGRRFVRIQFSERTSQVVLVRSLYQALSGDNREKNGLTQHAMKFRCLEALVDGDVGVIADDVHLVGVGGLQMLRWFHDQVAAERADDGRGFPLWLVGTDVVRAIVSCSELATRVEDWTEFRPLDDAEVAEHIGGLNPRLAVSSPEQIAELDMKAKGSLRKWYRIERRIRRLWPDRDGPLTKDEVSVLMSVKSFAGAFEAADDDE